MRFINADGLVSTGQGLLGTNMFAYCGNNSVNRFDPTGTEGIRNVFLHWRNNILRAFGVDTAAAGAPVIDMKKDSKGVYHVKNNCVQQYGGHNDLYDKIF